MAENNPQILFDKFEIIECFKKDDFTGVYLAKHIYLSKEIILKCLNTETVPDNSVVERFKREAKILAKLEHPSIIKVYDFGTYEKYFYISFEYFRGNSLRDTIKANKATSADKKEILIEILEGLAEAHKNGIIHRDIKPENIFVDPKYKIKIGDFGLALSKTESYVTSKSSIVGTPCYMSPEQISGDKVTTATDLFSLGVVTYELFTGTNPLLGEDINETINNVISKDFKKLFVKRDEIPSDINQFLDATIRRKPADRIDTCEEALKILGAENRIKEDSSSNDSRIKNTIGKRLGYSALVTLLVLLVIYFMPLSSDKNDKLPGQDTTEVTLNNETVPPAIESNDQPVENDQQDEGANEIKSVDNSDSEDNSKPANADNLEENKPLAIPVIPEEEKVIEYGSLDVECIPWAKIYIDSVEYDTTPLEEPIRLVSGDYIIRLVHPNFPPYRKKISIDPERLASIKVSLDTLYGWLDCRVFPWGELTVNGRRIGQTPLQNPLQLVPGKYNLQVSNPHFETYYDTVFVGRNDTLTVRVTFKKQ